MRTLVLNQGYQPHRIVDWDDACEALYKGSATIVEVYDEPLRTIRVDELDHFEFEYTMQAWVEKCITDQDSDEITLMMPSVIRLVNNVPFQKGIRYSKRNMFVRDDYTCQYCGSKLPKDQLNREHIFPRSRGGQTTWKNTVTACYDCNSKKRDRTPEEAGMSLICEPAVPSRLPVRGIVLDHERGGLPETWYNWV